MFTCFRPKKNNEALYRAVTEKKNRRMDASFAAVPFADRLVFVPHCMRSSSGCRAREEGSFYQCAECGLCKIAPISRKARELGYGGLFILKGGRTVEKLIQGRRPKAVVGVACFFEGAQGMELTEKHDLAVQFVPLTKDGCADTDVDVDEVFAVLEKRR